ncbi:MAG: hypothetical protein WD805_03895 [Gaiellaceae bacterium]
MEAKQAGRVSRRWRTAALLSVGVVVGLLVAGTPATAHFGSVKHFVKTHVLPKTDKRYYKKAPADARFVNVAEPAGGALDGTYPNPILRPGSVTAASFGAIPAARAQHKDTLPVTTQAVPSGTFTKVTFDVETYDTDGMFDPAAPTRLTVKTPGVYLVTGAVRWDPNATGSRSIGIVRNDIGIAFLAADTRDAVATASTATRQNVSTVARLAAGDYVELKAEQTSGGSLNINHNGSPQVHLSATWLAP